MHKHARFFKYLYTSANNIINHSNTLLYNERIGILKWNCGFCHVIEQQGGI